MGWGGGGQRGGGEDIGVALLWATKYTLNIIKFYLGRLKKYVTVRVEKMRRNSLTFITSESLKGQSHENCVLFFLHFRIIRP